MNGEFSIMWEKHGKTIINNRFGNGLYHLSMVIAGMVSHCFTHMIYVSSTASPHEIPALRCPSRETRSRDQQASRYRLGEVVLGTCSSVRIPTVTRVTSMDWSWNGFLRAERETM